MLHYREPSKSVKRTIAGMALAIVSLLALAACSSDDGDEVDRRLAESFLRNSPTFRFDGLPDTVELLDRAAGDCETCVAYTFGFESSHPGYGDRTDLPLAAAVTPHEAIISIQEGLVTGARIDSIWDVIEQSPIVRTTTAEDGSRATAVTALLDSPFELHIGQEAVFGDEGLTITFVDVSEDSRCPAATNCVVSGLAKVRLDVLAGERPLGMHEFVLDQRTIGGTARGIGQYVFSMRELNPYPGTDTAPYAAILVVSKVVAA